jgi:rubrerythrin
MRFESARDALKHAKDFHLQSLEFFQVLAKQENIPRTKLLLDYMISQEKSLAKSLDDYEKNTPTGVLDTWLQYANDEAILKLPVIEAFQSKKSMEDILGISMKMSDDLIKVYQLVEEQINEDNVKNIFNNLADMQMQKQKRLSINVDRLMDL